MRASVRSRTFAILRARRAVMVELVSMAAISRCTAVIIRQIPATIAMPAMMIPSTTYRVLR